MCPGFNYPFLLLFNIFFFKIHILIYNFFYLLHYVGPFFVIYMYRTLNWRNSLTVAGCFNFNVILHEFSFNAHNTLRLRFHCKAALASNCNCTTFCTMKINNSDWIWFLLITIALAGSFWKGTFSDHVSLLAHIPLFVMT